MDNTHVPDKLEAYLLQVRHALFELICVEERVVSIEAYDDVAVETEDELVAVQAKNVLSNNNPVANRAIAFWKAIKNWCTYLNSGALPDKKVVLRYVIVANRGITVGNIPDSFFKATNETEAKKALEQARNEIYGERGEKAASIGTQMKPYTDYCFSSENESTVLKVISLMELDIHEENYDENLRARFNGQTIPLEYSEELFISMLGWVAEQVHMQTKENLPAFISSVDYKNALRAAIRGRDQSKIFSAVSVQPEELRTNIEIERRDTYIRQLELIDAETTQLYEAASDFLRTKAEKTEWAKRGLVTKESFAEYYDGLKRIWNGKKTMAAYFPVDNEKVKGKIVYTQCCEEAIKHRIQGNDVPNFFGSGSLHTMANEPAQSPEIGWHPNYKELLKRKGDEGEKD